MYSLQLDGNHFVMPSLSNRKQLIWPKMHNTDMNVTLRDVLLSGKTTAKERKNKGAPQERPKVGGS